ncbi:MAG: 3-dehydroquinate synthase [Pyrinomonadaceae bacterium]|nr:3-dehydroquinate synthase [Pyrinomonadaceae bacterium]
MKNETVHVRLGTNTHQYKIEIGHDTLDECGVWAKSSLPETTKKIIIASNRKVFRLYGEAVQNSLEKSGYEVFVWLMKDGEKHKNLRSLENALGFFSSNTLSRTDSVVALGGGVVGDLAGFAAAIYQRGIAFLQIPTTFLAMIDSSVGGKTAVNSGFGKNLIGAFHQPNGVLIDISTLKTLPKRELIAGFCEAVKQGAISDERLFNQTAEFLRDYALNKFKKFYSDEKFVSALKKLIAAQVSFKAEIVQQDERENSDRSDVKSRKILNFGHTLGHALEKVTDYKYFKHGEAVGYGILFAAELSKTLDIFDGNEVKLLNDVIHRVGKLPDTGNINLEEVIKAFVFDKKTVGKSLQWILLEGIGKPKIYTDKDIPNSAILKTLKKVLHSRN